MCVVIARVVLVTALAAACGDAPAHVTLVPVDLGGCGMPPGVTHLRVYAYTPSDQVVTDVSAPTELGSLPADTLQLGVEASVANGDVQAIGKTMPLAFDSLADHAEIRIAMLAQDGFCATGDLGEPRIDPAIALAGDGALVVGGYALDGAMNHVPLATADYYDPTTATFQPVDVPVDLGATGFAGAVLTELADGRVLITGPEHVAMTFDPTTRELTPGSFGEERAFHGAIQLDATHVLIAGGCNGVMGDTCVDFPLKSAYDYPIASLANTATRVSSAALTGKRYGARLYDLGEQADGSERYVLAGGFGDPATADRFALADDTATGLAGFHAQVVPLDGGALLTALEPDGSAQTGAAGQLAPDAGATTAIASAPAFDGSRLVALEDGTVLALGGDASVSSYSPTTDAWTPVALAGNPPPALGSPAVIRLRDGTVLVAGGAIAGVSSPHAWLYRPSLVGPQSKTASAFPTSSANSALTAPDPAAVNRSIGFTLSASDDSLAARALVGGPRMTTGSLSATVGVLGGGVALIAQQLGPGRALVALLAPDEPIVIERLDGGAATTLCTGDDPVVLGGTSNLTFAVSGHTASVDAGTTQLTCDLSGDPDASDRGAWGIAALSGAQVSIITIQATRAP